MSLRVCPALGAVLGHTGPRDKWDTVPALGESDPHSDVGQIKREVTRGVRRRRPRRVDERPPVEAVALGGLLGGGDSSSLTHE